MEPLDAPFFAPKLFSRVHPVHPSVAFWCQQVARSCLRSQRLSATRCGFSSKETCNRTGRTWAKRVEIHVNVWSEPMVNSQLARSILLFMDVHGVRLYIYSNQSGDSHGHQFSFSTSTGDIKSAFDLDHEYLVKRIQKNLKRSLYRDNLFFSRPAASFLHPFQVLPFTRSSSFSGSVCGFHGLTASQNKVSEIVCCKHITRNL